MSPKISNSTATLEDSYLQPKHKLQYCAIFSYFLFCLDKRDGFSLLGYPMHYALVGLLHSLDELL